MQKITSMVNDVEKRLVNLVVMAGQVDKMTGIKHGEIHAEQQDVDINKGVGPQLDAENKEDVAANQDDVDDLLSSLGF